MFNRVFYRAGTINMVLVLFFFLTLFACSAPAAENHALSPSGKSSFQTHIRAICNSVTNFNDLSKRHPNEEAFNGYADVLNNQIESIQRDHESEIAENKEFTEELNALQKHVDQLKTGSAEQRLAAHKQIFTIQSGWQHKFDLN